MRIIIKYARSGAAKYISHLDMQRAFSRAIRRAGVDAEYSQGFNPHVVMSFASPLSVGYATEGDYLEVGVAEGTDGNEVKEKLNAVLTEDIRVVDAFPAGDSKKKLMAMNHSAEYRVTFAVENERDCDKIKDSVKKIADSGSYITEDRRGKAVDIAPLLLSMRTEGGGVRAVLKNASDGALNPAVLAEAVLKEAGIDAPYEICRLECYGTIDGAVTPFTTLKNV